MKPISYNQEMADTEVLQLILDSPILAESLVLIRLCRETKVIG